jgi:sugar/nucleoside kinase (ribokinase family)
MDSTPFIRFLIAGHLRRDFIISANGETYFDQPGGNLLYAASGMAVWEESIGLIGRIGEDYPQIWLNQLEQYGFDCRGIKVVPDSLDLRYFRSYMNDGPVRSEHIISKFSSLDIPFPKSLLGYSEKEQKIDSRNQILPDSIRMTDIPESYMDATATHICPMDFLSHSILPSLLRKGNISTVTIEPPASYMDPSFWIDIPLIFKGITAVITSEKKLSNLFKGRSVDVWEMAEALCEYDPEIVVIKRGSKGQYIYDKMTKKRWSIPAYPAKVFDTTGAGDAFAGGFLAGYRNNYSPVEAALHGNISASLIIEGNGPFYALDALPNLAQARLESLRDAARKI